ncbi:MAG TPA: hypothetical protein PKC21_03935 [Oligoflexia bacterium]|nr:hypothetical protein [Oligoflexia bacterium]HMR24488.1 hypothetical protein [Oligoflexia bacterium]
MLKAKLVMRNLAYSLSLSTALLMSSCNLTQRGDINPPQQRYAAANAIENNTSSSLSGGSAYGVEWRGNKHFVYVLSPENQCNIPVQEQQNNPWEVTESTGSGSRPWEVNTGTSVGRISLIAVDDSFQSNSYGHVLNNGNTIINGQRISGNAGQTLSGLNFSSDEKVASNIAVSPFKLWVTQQRGLYGIPFDSNSGALDFSYNKREVRFVGAEQPMNLVTTNVLHVQKGNRLERREYVFASFTGIPKIGYRINKEDAATGRPLAPITRTLDFSNHMAGTKITSLNMYGDLLAVGFQQGQGRGATALCKILYLTNEMPEPAVEDRIDDLNIVTPDGCWLRNTVAQEQAPIDNWFSQLGWFSVTPTYGVMIMPEVPALLGKDSTLENIVDASITGTGRNGFVHVTLQSEKRNAVDMTNADWSFKKVATAQDRAIIALQNDGTITAYSLDNIFATNNGKKELQFSANSRASDMAMAPGTLQKDGTYIRNGEFMAVNQAQRGSVLILPVYDGLPNQPSIEAEVFTRCAGHRLAIKPMIDSDFRNYNNNSGNE